MAFVQEKLHEGAFITEFMALLKKEGNWKIGDKFFKIGIPVSTLGGDGMIEPDTRLTFMIAQHQQATNALGAIFGLARTLSVSIAYRDLPTIFKAKANLLDDAKRKEMHDHIKTFWPADEDNTIQLNNAKFYTYMARKERVVASSSYLKSPVATEVGVLDVEMGDYTVKTSTTSGSTAYVVDYDLEAAINDPLMFQSPITKVDMRATSTASTNAWESNWWPDSKVRVNGWVDEETAAVVLQSDAAAAPEDAVVPAVPLYWGSVDPLDKNSNGADDHALFSGTAPTSATYDFSSTTKFQSSPMMPVKKKYTKYPSNGIDDVTIMRTSDGSYYQAHYIKAFNPPEAMEPDRKHDGKQIPTAWKQETADEYTYPPVSAYTGKTDSSPAYIVHPEERDRGELKKIIIAPSVGIKKNSHFKVARGTCPETYDYYKCYDIDAISPLTKRPSTQYRPMMLAIFEGDEPK